MVEKRLLVRYKDRNPTPLSGLDALMRETYNKLLAISKCLLCTTCSVRVMYLVLMFEGVLQRVSRERATQLRTEIIHAYITRLCHSPPNCSVTAQATRWRSSRAWSAAASPSSRATRASWPPWPRSSMVRTVARYYEREV
jgi:hypothetical protein